MGAPRSRTPGTHGLEPCRLHQYGSSASNGVIRLNATRSSGHRGWAVPRSMPWNRISQPIEPSRRAVRSSPRRAHRRKHQPAPRLRRRPEPATGWRRPTASHVGRSRHPEHHHERQRDHRVHQMRRIAPQQRGLITHQYDADEGEKQPALVRRAVTPGEWQAGATMRR